MEGGRMEMKVESEKEKTKQPQCHQSHILWHAHLLHSGLRLLAHLHFPRGLILLGTQLVLVAAPAQLVLVLRPLHGREGEEWREHISKCAREKGEFVKFNFDSFSLKKYYMSTFYPPSSPSSPSPTACCCRVSSSNVLRCSSATTRALWISISFWCSTASCAERGGIA